MTRLTAKDFAPELLELYDYYAHGKINRREFLDRAAVFALGTTALSVLTALREANQIPAGRRIKPGSLVLVSKSSGLGIRK